MTPLSTPPIIIDSTILMSMRSCSRKFYNEFVRRKTLAERSIPLRAGGAFAAGLEQYRIAHYVHNLSPASCLESAIAAMSISWGESDPFPPDPKTQSTYVARTLARTISALRAYVTLWPPALDRLQPIPMNRESETSFEYSFSLPLDDPMFPLHPNGEPYIFAGRCDTLGTYDGIPCWSDEKTTGAMGVTWAQQWPLRNQFIGYRWALRALGRSERLCVVRGICILKEDVKLAEAQVHYPDHLLSDFAHTLAHDLNTLNYCFEHNVWNKEFGDSCTAYGGCDYRDLCLAAPSIERAALRSYADRTWDPTARHERPRVLSAWNQ